MLTPDERRTRLLELIKDLRAALAAGCPVWLVAPVHRCITDLELLVMAEARDAEVATVCAQAETLIEVCRASTSRAG